MRIRSVIVFFLFIFAISALSVRLMRVAEQPVALSHGAMRLMVDESRGAILDRHGSPIVHAEQHTIAAVRPSPTASAVLRGMLSEQRWFEADERLSRGRLVAVRVDADSSPTPDIQLLEVYPRFAVQQPAAHLVGHLDANGAGATGLERAFEPLLGGASGTLMLRLASDAHGRALPGAALEVHDQNYRSRAGIQLTIDLEIQRVVEAATRHYNLEQGAVIVLCNSTGEILALASSPAFDPNNIAATMHCSLEPFFNRALGAYAIGSTFKTFIAAAALDQRISSTREFLCEGQMDVAGRIYRCINETAHGMVCMPQALAHSCNLYFIQLATQMQREPMLDIVRLFGFGEEIHLADGIRSARGNIPAIGYLALPGELANFAFGQGMLLGTPLQMAAATAVIANGGTYRTPTLVQATICEFGRVTPFVNDIIETREVITPEQAQQLRNMMILTVEEGTGGSARPTSGGAGGKTATAQSGRFREDGSEILMTSFTGFVPAENPRYTITVFRQDGVSGAADCGPVFRKIANALTSDG